MRILLIDDDVSVVDNLKLFLRAEFHAVESLTYVKDYEHLVKNLGQFDPDGIILDYGMEHKGTEIYRWIRTWKQNTAIIFYTNYANSQENGHMVNVGANKEHIVPKREVGLDLDLILNALRSQL